MKCSSRDAREVKSTVATHRTEGRGPVPEASCQVMRLKEATVSILKANKEIKGTVTTTFIAGRYLVRFPNGEFFVRVCSHATEQ